MAQKHEYVVLEFIESAFRNAKTAPLNLGGVGGFGGGAGGPPGGFIGRLPQYQVAYDVTEAATLDTLPSGLAGASGWSLVDNLNHIRYRLNVLESGGSIVVFDDNEIIEYPDTTVIHFSGAGVVVNDLGAGEVQVVIEATGSGGGATGIEVRENGVSQGTGIIVIDVVGADVSVVGNVATITISGGAAGEEVLHYYNDDLTSQIATQIFTTTKTYMSGTLRVYYNGDRQRKGVHYLDDVDFTTFSTYFPTYSGDVMIVDYDYLESQQTGGEFSLVDSDAIVIVDSEGIELTETL